jgi:RNA polymerase sigma-32 factor
MTSTVGSIDKPACDMSSLLGATEEQMLCRRWYEHHDIAAAGILVGNHLHLIARIATAHERFGTLTQALIGEGYVELMRAACRYDPAWGSSFTSYAAWWVRAAIQQCTSRAAHASK